MDKPEKKNEQKERPAEKRLVEQRKQWDADRGMKSLLQEAKKAEQTKIKEKGESKKSKDSKHAQIEKLREIRRKLAKGDRITPLMTQGKIGEQAALRNSDRVSLDEVVEKAKLSTQGKRFPIYDNIGQSSVASVKVRGIDYHRRPRPEKEYVNRYVKDFYTATGLDENASQRFEKAASLLLEAKEKRAIPQVKNMENIKTVRGMQQYLRQHGELQIPDNHVPKVQKALQEKIATYPENFGLKGKPTKAEIDRLTQRVKPIGATTDDIKHSLKDV